MSWKDVITDALFEPEVGAADKAASVTAGTASIGQAPAQASVAVVEELRRTVFGGNTAFTRLIATFDGMASVIPDETMRFNAAVAAVTASGTSKTDIAAAVAVHQKNILREQEGFKEKLADDRQQSIGVAEAQANRLTEEATSVDAQLAQLQARRKEIDGEIAQRRATIATEDERLRHMEAAFTAAVTVVQTELQTLAGRL